jgi:hypothetical protein
LTGTTSASQVEALTMPLAVRAWAVWNVTTALFVAASKSPVIGIADPCARRRPWIADTLAPRSWRFWTGQVSRTLAAETGAA